MVALGLLAGASARAEETRRPTTDEVNAANNPLTPKVTLNLHDYVAPVLNRLGGRTSNQFLLRGLVPSDGFGVPQLTRFTLPVATAPLLPSGSETGVGDLTLYQLAVFEVPGATLSIGPLLVVPTASGNALGTGRWQAGAAALAVSPQPWGMMIGLLTWQHSFGAPNGRGPAQLLTVQPILTWNLADGWYLRSSGSWSFDLAQRTTTVPVGFGLGKVWNLSDRLTLNAFVEPQYSVIRSGVGVPVWQVFAGVNLQWALRVP